MTQELIQTTNVLQDFKEDTNKHVDKFKEWDLNIFLNARKHKPTNETRKSIQDIKLRSNKEIEIAKKNKTETIQEMSNENLRGKH